MSSNSTHGGSGPNPARKGDIIDLDRSLTDTHNSHTGESRKKRKISTERKSTGSTDQFSQLKPWDSRAHKPPHHIVEVVVPLRNQTSGSGSISSTTHHLSEVNLQEQDLLQHSLEPITWELNGICDIAGPIAHCLIATEDPQGHVLFLSHPKTGQEGNAGSHPNIHTTSSLYVQDEISIPAHVEHIQISNDGKEVYYYIRNKLYKYNVGSKTSVSFDISLSGTIERMLLGNDRVDFITQKKNAEKNQFNIERFPLDPATSLWETHTAIHTAIIEAPTENKIWGQANHCAYMYHRSDDNKNYIKIWDPNSFRFEERSVKHEGKFNYNDVIGFDTVRNDKGSMNVVIATPDHLLCLYPPTQDGSSSGRRIDMQQQGAKFKAIASTPCQSYLFVCIEKRQRYSLLIYKPGFKKAEARIELSDVFSNTNDPGSEVVGMRVTHGAEKILFMLKNKSIKVLEGKLKKPLATEF